MRGLNICRIMGKEERMSDLISRSQLLKEIETWGGCVEALHDYIQIMPTAYDINKVVEELNELDVKSITRYKNGNFGNFDGVEYYIKKRKAIEIVKQEAEKFGTDINVVSNGWIPCSERLPEIDGNTSDTVLVCGSNGFLYMAFWCDDLQWRFCECGMAKEPVLWTEIIAWQPLPEPYKERD